MEPDRWPGPGRRSAPGPRRSARGVFPAGRHRCDQRIDYVFFRSRHEDQPVNVESVVLAGGLTACFRPTIERWSNNVFRLYADGPPTVFAHQGPTGRRRQPELGATAAGTAEQPPAGGAHTGAGSRRVNLVLVSRAPRLADPLGAGPPCRPGRPTRCRHGAWPFARVSGRAVHPTKPCPAATAAAAASAPNPQRRSNVAHRHRLGPHRPERAAGSLTPASSSAHCTPMTAPT
jgi:hypothetical protein